MKKTKMLLAAVAVVTVIGGTYAFTKKHDPNLFQRQIDKPTNCIEANATDFNTGTPVSPASGFQGFYLTSNCSDTQIPGYLPNVQ